MLDFLRNWRKSEREQRQEQLNAYLDGELSRGEGQRFEQALADDAALQRELAQLQLIKQQVKQLPRLRAPRNFTLDPAKYGRPARQPLLQLYPVLRTATVMTAVMFIVALAAGVFMPGGLTGSAGSEPVADEVAVSQVVEEEAAEAPAAAMPAQETTPLARAIITKEADLPEPAAEEVAEEAEMAAQAAPTVGEAAAPASTPLAADEAPESPTVAAAATTEALASLQVTMEPDLGAGVSQTPETVVVPPEEVAGAVDAAADDAAADDAAIEEPPAGPTAVTIVQIVLGSLLVLLLATTLWLRRRV